MKAYIVYNEDYESGSDGSSNSIFTPECVFIGADAKKQAEAYVKAKENSWTHLSISGEVPVNVGVKEKEPHHFPGDFLDMP
jgi:hypothetical protein